MRKLLLFSAIIVLLAACTRREKGATNSYVDVPAFINEQAALYKTFKGHKLIKILTIDGVGETKELLCDTFDLKKELSVFADVDVNKTAYKGVFQIDTTYTDSTYTVTYTNKADNKLPLKELNASYLKATNAFYELDLYTAHGNMLSSNEQKLMMIHTPKKSAYSIYIKDNLKTGRSTVTTVEAEVVK